MVRWNFCTSCSNYRGCNRHGIGKIGREVGFQASAAAWVLSSFGILLYAVYNGGFLPTFGTTYRFHLLGSSSPRRTTDCLILQDGAHKLYRKVGEKTPFYAAYSKVKCTLVQALRLCTVRTAQSGSRGVALLFYDHGTRTEWRVNVTSRPLFTLGKTRYPLYRRLGGPQGRSGQVRNISPPPGFDPRTVQPVASRYTD